MRTDPRGDRPFRAIDQAMWGSVSGCHLGDLLAYFQPFKRWRTAKQAQNEDGLRELLWRVLGIAILDLFGQFFLVAASQRSLRVFVMLVYRSGFSVKIRFWIISGGPI